MWRNVPQAPGVSAASTPGRGPPEPGAQGPRPGAPGRAPPVASPGVLRCASALPRPKWRPPAKGRAPATPGLGGEGSMRFFECLGHGQAEGRTLGLCNAWLWGVLRIPGGPLARRWAPPRFSGPHGDLPGRMTDPVARQMQGPSGVEAHGLWRPRVCGSPVGRSAARSVAGNPGSPRPRPLGVVRGGPVLAPGLWTRPRHTAVQ